MKNLPVNISPPALSSLDPALLQAILIAGFVFIFALLLGLSRRYIISSSLQGVWAGFVVGFVGLFLVEAGIFWGIKSFVNEEKKAGLPANLRLIVDNSTQSLTRVLGIKTERERPTAQSVVSDYSALTPLDAELAKNSICKQE